MIATLDKLTGDVDSDALLAAVPDEVEKLPGFTGFADLGADAVKSGTMGGLSRIPIQPSVHQ